MPLTCIREQEWYCTQCDNIEQVTKKVTEPSDKARIFNRLLKIPGDYDALGVSITSEADGITFKIRLPDYDVAEVRAVQLKQHETGFITVEELMKLQKAGFNRPSEVPPKPQAKDRRTLRERARQRIFQGEPRSI